MRPDAEPRTSESQSRPQRQIALARNFAFIADRAAHIIGQPFTFMLTCIVITFWTIACIFFRLPGGWQLLVNAVSVITFLMVFLIQSTQNRNGAAIQAKLDELIRALEPAENKFMGIEKLTVEEVRELREECIEEVKILEERVEETLEECGQLDAAQKRLASQDA